MGNPPPPNQSKNDGSNYRARTIDTGHTTNDKSFQDSIRNPLVNDLGLGKKLIVGCAFIVLIIIPGVVYSIYPTLQIGRVLISKAYVSIDLRIGGYGSFIITSIVGDAEDPNSGRNVWYLQKAYNQQVILPSEFRFWHEAIGQFATTSGTGLACKLTITVWGTWAFLGRPQQMNLTASTSVHFQTS